MKASRATVSDSNLSFDDQEPPIPNLKEEVIKGLSSSPKTLNAKFFYDEKGSQLFEEITQLPEYYLTRTEISILKNEIQNIKQTLGEETVLIEYGSGSSEKIKLMLEELNPQAYLPIDISKDFLLSAAEDLSAEFPDLPIHAICADYNEVVNIPTEFANSNKVAFFPGSTIGNFTPEDAKKFLSNVRQTIGDNGGLLIGVDVKKDKTALHNAYNDSQGVTADFNLNMLSNVNELVNADFDLEQYEHDAFYNTEKGRIEMHLKSRSNQVVNIDNVQVTFAKGERLHTENSYKYHVEEFIALASKVGFKSKEVWIDKEEKFSVHYLQVA